MAAVADAAEDDRHRARRTRACACRCRCPPSELEGRLERKAQQLGRELKLPGFRRGKVPRAAGDPARRPRGRARGGRARHALELVRRRDRDAGIVPVGDPQARPRRAARRRGEALEFSIEIGVLPKARARRLRRPRGRRAASRRSTRSRSSARSTACASAWRARDRRARRRRGRLRRDRLRRLAACAAGRRRGRRSASCEPFAGGEGRDQLVELGGGNLIPGFEEALRRRERRRDARRSS